MRVMAFVPGNKRTEAGQMPTADELGTMMKFNEELVKAGVMVGGDGLYPTSRAKRVRFSGSERTVTDGPFAETKELVAGYWIWEVKSIDDAVEWLKRAPFDEGTEVTIRPIFGAEDFGEAMTPELRAKNDELRAKTEASQQKSH